MLRITTTRLRLLALLLSVAAVFVFAPNAFAASITVARAPAPPAAVLNDGAHSLSYNYSVSYTTTPELICVQIVDPSGNPVAGSTTATPLVSTTTSPYSATGSYTVPSGLAPGRYLVQVAYYSVELSGTITTCPTNLVTNNTYEALVQAQFGVAASVGTITVEKFDDLNGSGVFAANDPLVPNFNFSVTAPNPDFVGTTNYAEVTDVGGTFVLTGVPAGPNATYTISEVLPDPNPLAWTPSTGTGSQTFTLTTNGQNQTLLFGNVQLTSLCGTVYEDTGHVGKFASGQPGVPGVVLTLGGASGAGVAVPAGKTETSDANGNYCFNGLYPGTYSVSEGTPPATLSTETDIDGIANGANYIDPIAVTSGTPSEGNNFLLVPPVPLPPVVTPKPKPTPKPTPKPKPKPKPVLTKLCISKHVNLAQVKQGQAVTWTVTVKDCGKNTAKRVTTTDPLLAGITLNNTDGAKLVLGQLVWDTGTLKRGQSRTYRFVTRFSTNAALGIHVNHANAVAANAKRVNAQAQTRVVALPRPPIAVPITG